MSDYPPAAPYAVYGQSQTNTPYAQPTYPNQYMQQDDGRAAHAHMASNYNAYGYNNSIPGFNAGSVAPAAPQLPIYQGWNQDAVSVPSYLPQSTMPYSGYGVNQYQPQQNYAPQPQTYHQNTQQIQQHAHQHVAHYDEGELSEGEFDAYGGRKNGGNASAEYGPNYYQGNDGTGFINTAQRAVYPNGQDYINQSHQSQQSGNNYNNNQRESKSYSPYAASPAEPVPDERWKGKQNTNTHSPANVSARPANGTSWTQSSAPQNTQSIPVHTGPKHHKPMDSGPRPQRANSIHTNSTTRTAPVDAPSVPPVKPFSTGEASSRRDAKLSPSVTRNISDRVLYLKKRKEAEGAILNLWSQEVRFPEYVLAGYDEEIIGTLFDDLKFSRAPKAVIVEPKSTSQKPDAEVAHHSFDSQTVHQSDHEVGEVGGSVLAESTDNNLNASVPVVKAPTADNKPTEKEKNLKLKMEALRKSRVERAQKAAEVKTKTQNSPAGTAQAEPSTPISSEPPNSLSTSLLQATLSASEMQPSSIVASTNNVQVLPTISQSLPSSQPLIPGLFLASSSQSIPLPINPNPTMLGGPPTNPRKRPVAADFDTPTSSLPQKRPFSPTRHEPLIIDVSEEEVESEDEGVAMDLDSQADLNSPLQSASRMPDLRNTGLQDLAPLTSFSNRKTLASPGSSAASTPPIAIVPKPSGQPQNLLMTEKKIEELKKKIAAKEAVTAAKRRAQQASSGAATPQLQPSNGAPSTNGTSDIASRVEASLEMQQLIEVAEDKVQSDQQKLAKTQAAEQEKAAELERSELESKRLHRERLATDLPRVDAEVEEKQRKLFEMREAIAKIEADMQKSLDDKKRIAAEMERLGREAEDQLQEQTDKLKVLTNETASPSARPPITLSTVQRNAEPIGLPARPANTQISSATVSPPQSARPSQPELSQAAPVPGVAGVSTDTAARKPDGIVSMFNGGANRTTITGAFNNQAGLPAAKVLQASYEPSGSTNMTGGEVVKQNTNGEEAGRRRSTNGIDSSASTSDTALEAALQEQVRAEAESHEQSEEDMDIEDSYAPDPAQLAPKSSTNSIVGGSPVVLQHPLQTNGRHDSRKDQLGNDSHNFLEKDTDQNENDDDYDYEPPEATPPNHEAFPIDPIDIPPFSPPTLEPVTDLDQLPSGRDFLEDPAVGDVTEQFHTNGLALTEDAEKSSNQIPMFTPYESPLKQFRAFRFHPDFKQQVSGGLKSMTYSHKINPQKEFCQFELAGGVCNDKSCEYQHFKDVAVLDDIIISSLGTPEEFPEDQRQKFREGLRVVLTDLRLRKVRDFDTIAAEVIAHRSKFMGDPTKVLGPILEGASI